MSRALLGHAPGLDGLRGVAVLLVMSYHFLGHYVLKGAWASLDMFFALSGFLITVLILDERRVHGRSDLRRFYARRACRLLPALFAMLFLWTCVLLVFHNDTFVGDTPSDSNGGHIIHVAGALKAIGLALVYAANWDVIDNGMAAPLSHLWSLAVEEQFYIVWPSVLLALLLLGRRARLGFVLGGITVSAILPWLYWDGTSAGSGRIYFGTDTRAASLLLGAFAGLIWHERHALGKAARFPALRAWSAVVVLALIVDRYTMDDKAKYVVVPAFTALCVAQVVPYLADNGTGLLVRMFSFRPLVWVGKRSYALYLWHYVWATWTHPFGLVVGVPLGIAASFATTALSWKYVEEPVLRWSKRFRVAPAPLPAPRPGLALATA